MGVARVALWSKPDTQYSRKNRVLYSKKIWVIVILTVALLVLTVVVPGFTVGNATAGFPLLLESGWSNEPVARAQIVLWFDNMEIPATIRAGLPQTGWDWKESVQPGVNGHQAISLAGSRFVDKADETGLKQLYFELDRLARAAGGRAYLDERIAEGIDIAGYLSVTGAEPKQWSLQDGTWSLTAYVSGPEGGIQAGQDVVNVQLVRRGGEGSKAGVTALALPVLLNEF